MTTISMETGTFRINASNAPDISVDFSIPLRRAYSSAQSINIGITRMHLATGQDPGTIKIDSVALAGPKGAHDRIDGTLVFTEASPGRAFYWVILSYALVGTLAEETARYAKAS